MDSKTEPASEAKEQAAKHFTKHAEQHAAQQLSEYKEVIKELLPLLEKSIEMHGHAYSFSDAEFEQLQIESIPIIDRAKKLIEK